MMATLSNCVLNNWSSDYVSSVYCAHIVRHCSIRTHTSLSRFRESLICDGTLETKPENRILLYRQINPCCSRIQMHDVKQRPTMKCPQQTQTCIQLSYILYVRVWLCVVEVLHLECRDTNVVLLIFVQTSTQIPSLDAFL